MKRFYWLERAHDGSVTANRATQLEDGSWMETGCKKFEGEDAEARARDYIPKGLKRSWPPGYGMSGVIEYWE